MLLSNIFYDSDTWITKEETNKNKINNCTACQRNKEV